MKGIELAWYASGIVKNKMYIASEFLKKICEVDMDTKKVNTLCHVDCQAFFEEMHAIRECVTYQDSVFFLGMHGTGFFKYCIGDGNYNAKIIDNSAYMATHIKEDDARIIVSTVKPWEKIWRLDLSSGQYFEIHTNSSLIEKIKTEDNVAHYAELYENKIYYPLIKNEYIVVLDLAKNRFASIRIGGSRFFGIVKYRDTLFLSLYGSYDLVSYNIKNKLKKKIKIGKEKFDNEAVSPYVKMYLYDTNLILLPSIVTDKIRILSLVDNSIVTLVYPEGFRFKKKDKYLYTFAEVSRYKEKLIISQLSSNMMLELDLRTLELRGFEIVASDSKERIAEFAYNKEVIQESNEIDLDTFLDNI